MKHMLKKILVMMALVGACAVPQLKAEEAADSGLGITTGVQYMSNYLWRGTYWYGGEGAFFPSASYDVLKSGLIVGVCGELSENWVGKDENKAVVGKHAFDFGADFSHTFAEAVTLGVGAWYYRCKDDDNSYGSGYVSLAVDALPLKPTVKYTRDYYTGDSDVVGDEGKDYYVQLLLSHSVELIKDAASLNLGASLGYYNVESYYADQQGISDIDLSSGLSVTKGIVTFASSFHYVIVPSDDFKYVNGQRDINRFYSTFSVSCSI
jgi:hypothetical protein